MDTVRVFRLLEYVGDRDRVEATLKKSITGEMSIPGLTIRAATLGTFPEILERANAPERDPSGPPPGGPPRQHE